MDTQAEERRILAVAAMEVAGEEREVFPAQRSH
jgi:hypothetical protein